MCPVTVCVTVHMYGTRVSASAVKDSCSFATDCCVQIDVLIVGGGVIGIATAYTLCKTRPDLCVALLEAGQIGTINGR